MEQYQKLQHVCNWSARKRTESKEQKKTVKYIMAKNFQNLMVDIHLQHQET